MNERNLYPEIEHTFDYYQIFWHKNQDFRYERGGQVTHKQEGAKKVHPRKADPDFTIISPPYGLGFMIEVKKAEASTPSYFPFTKIEPHQRETLARFGGAQSFLWLYMGESLRHPDIPRRAWLIPWLKWLMIESRLKEYGLNCLNYHEPNAVKARNLGLGAVKLLADYQLTPSKYFGLNSENRGVLIWLIPSSNPFWNMQASILHERLTRVETNV